MIWVTGTPGVWFLPQLYGLGGEQPTQSPHLWLPAGVDGTTYDLRWIRAFHVDGDVVKIAFWGDPAARVTAPKDAFLAQWSASRADDPKLPGLPSVAGGPATLVVGNSTYNLLMVSGWGVHNGNPNLLAVRFYGMYSQNEDDGVSVVVFDRATFENAMNAFTLGGP